MEFLLGMLTMYLIVGLLLCLPLKYGGIELFDGWLSIVLCLPEVIVVGIWRFIWVKVIHRGQKQVYKRVNGKTVSYWIKKDREV